MAKDVDEILIGANGSFRVAPVGTAAPADESAAPGVGWIDLGYTNEDGITFTIDREIGVVNVWQLFEAARRFVTAREISLAGTIDQWNKETVKLAFGGGTTTTPTAGHHQFEPAEPQDLDERAAMVDWADGSRAYRLIVPRVTLTESLETTIARTGPAELPVTLGVLGTDGVKPFRLLTNDPAFA